LVADLVRGHRHRLGLTQDELADRCGVAVRTIRGIEAGRIVRPRPGTLRLLADVFGLTASARERFLHGALEGASSGDRTGATDRRPVPAELPADVPGFTGREAELAALDALIDPDTPTAAAVISAVSGTAGVGKTALAVRWGHRVVDRFPDGQLYINLRGYDPDQPVTPADALARLLDSLGVADSDIPVELDARAATYRTQVAGRRLLIVLDNASTVGQVRPLLPGAASCTVLVTSRDRMAGLVAREGAQRVDLDLLPLPDAIALLRTLVGQRVDAEPEATAALAHRCARLPLALRVAAELAVARPDTPLSDLATELADHQRRLRLLDADGDPGTDITAVFSWSLRHLSPDAAHLFRLLGLHPGPDISVAAAASLAGRDPAQIRSMLTDLVRANLLAEPVSGRYTLHDLLRDYAAHLTQAEDPASGRHDALTRLFDHYTQAAHAADRALRPTRERVPLPLPEPTRGSAAEVFRDPTQAMAWLTVEHPALLAAVRHAAASGFDTHAWQLAWALATFQDRRGYWPDRLLVWQIATEAADRLGHRPAQALAFRAAATAHADLRRNDAAFDYLRRALEVDIAMGDEVGQAQTRRTLSLLHSRHGRHDDCLRESLLALDLFRSAGHRRGIANALNSVGWAYAELAEYEQALRHCGEAVVLLQELDDHHGEAAAWDSLGYVHHRLGRQAEARDCYHRSIDLYRRLGDRYNEADTLSHLGDVHAGTGAAEAARAAWQQALDILTDIEHPDAEGVRAKLGRLTGPDEGPQGTSTGSGERGDLGEVARGQ
jgi:tetratricopeptide (TPR) repeat protein/transcriptional regulator with XRE-family HTH domain